MADFDLMARMGLDMTDVAKQFQSLGKLSNREMKKLTSAAKKTSDILANMNSQLKVENMTGYAQGVGAVALQMRTMVTFTTKAIPALKGFGTAINSALGPIGVGITLVTTFIELGKSLAEVLGKVKKETQSVSDKTAEQMTKLQYYTDTLATAKQGTEQYKQAEQGLIEQAHSLNAAVIKKKNGLIDLTATYNNLSKAIWNAAVQEAMFEQNKEDMKKILDLEMANAEKRKQKTGSESFVQTNPYGGVTTVSNDEIIDEQIKENQSKIDKLKKKIKESQDKANSLLESVIPEIAGDKTKNTGAGVGSLAHTRKLDTKEMKALGIYGVDEMMRAKQEDDKFWAEMKNRTEAPGQLKGKIQMLPVDTTPIETPADHKKSPMMDDSYIADLASTYSGLADNISGVAAALAQLSDSTALRGTAIIAEAIANLALSFSRAMMYEGNKGVWNWIAAGAAGLTTLLTMTTQLKSAGAFATGGIVGGNSFSGDNLTAAVNSGEMILNRRQQSNLFNMIDRGSAAGGGVVDFRIQGQQLVGVLNNYKSRTSKF